ncbi:alpha/beta fold hydrolase [Bacillus sp. SG-1]|uniref:alpha/beta fold hydrolase n=1 Tax=Bacillus sp. SG-1 TaxID=161544 RepID=UPI0001543FB0|nr:alpha/beta hydrolase [Bacillus sp. SG-1]EDL65397.1 hydrolase [Bacillus sp. SG-1]
METIIAEPLGTPFYSIQGGGIGQKITYVAVQPGFLGPKIGTLYNEAYSSGYSTGGSIVVEFLLTSSHRSLGGVIISGLSEVNDTLLKSRISLGVKLAKAGLVSLLSWSISRKNSNNKLFKKMFSDAKQGDYRNIEQYYTYSLHYNCTSRLGNINLPTLLIYGQKDKQFHSYANLLHDKLPDNELVLIENVDHRIPTKAANELNELLGQFVRRHTQ